MAPEASVTCLIETTEDTGAGCLKQARLADKVVCIDHKFVCCPVAAISDPAAFFGERAELFHAEGENWADWEDGKDWSRAIRGVSTGKTGTIPTAPKQNGPPPHKTPTPKPHQT